MFVFFIKLLSLIGSSFSNVFIVCCLFSFNYTECGTNHSIAHSNANFTGRASHYGTIVPVYCDKGYTVTGNQFSTCQANGKWSNTKCMLKGWYLNKQVAPCKTVCSEPSSA